MLWAAGISLATVLLFLAYLRQSQRVAVGSDGGSISLQAWDMLHGNVLLHGWAMSDVSFWSTELVQYAAIEAVRGLGPDVVHIGGAMTYTLLVLLAAWLAKGGATGREGLTRAALAVVIMLAPAPGASPTLLLTPDHLGSAVPVLLAWLAVDRLPARGPRWARWGTPVIVALLLAWGQLADGLILLTGVVPMLIVCGARTWKTRRSHPGPDVTLAVAAVLSAGIAHAAEALIRLRGGFVLKPVVTQFAGLAAMPQHVKLTAEGLLAIFGADFSAAHSAAGLGVAALHLAGVAAVAVAFVAALGRIGRGPEPAVPALALAIVLNVAAYLPTLYVQNLLSTREISAVLPFGAVLAGRLLARPLLTGPLIRVRRTRGARDGRRARRPARPLALWVAAALAAALVLALAGNAARPAVPPQNQSLASWLAARHLHAGLSASYWVANSTTLDTGGRVTVRQVTLQAGTLVRPLSWGFTSAWYNPRTQSADFVAASSARGSNWRAVRDAALRDFGPPWRVVRPAGYIVLIWHKNLLADIR